MININTIFKLCIFYLILVGAQAWFTMEQSFMVTTGISIFICLVSIRYKSKNGIRLRLNAHYLFAVVAFILASIFAHQITRLESLLTFTIRFFPIYLLLCDSLSAKETLVFVSKCMAVLFVPSILLHLFFLATTFPPSMPFTVESNSSYLFYNYGVLLKNISFEADSIRFCSVFLEPGYMGTMCAFLLYANRFQFKNNWFLFPIAAALILSLSLAGYLITFIGFIIYRYTNGISIRKYMLFLLIGFSAYLISLNYNEGNNILNHYIFSRLEQDDEKGISGNNRNSELADFYFEQSIRDGDVLWGLGAEKIRRINGGGANDGDFTNQIRGAGYKIFILYNGLLAAIFYLISYYYIASNNSMQKRKYCLGFFLLTLITFMQASYPHSFSWLVPYILGINSFKIRNNENRDTYISCRT